MTGVQTCALPILKMSDHINLQIRQVSGYLDIKLETFSITSDLGLFDVSEAENLRDSLQSYIDVINVFLENSN